MKPHEVLIEVAFAGVNRPVLAQRGGTYNPPPGASDLPELEVAGKIVALGADVKQWKIGEEVCALTPGGGYAQYCDTPASHCLPIPKGFTLLQAAMLPETYFTVWTNVFDRARLKKGESILVHGGASCIGTTAIQLAHAFGCTVYATVGDDAKKDACLKLGAVHVINYKTEDFVTVIRDKTGGKGVDVVLDMVASDYLQRNLEALAPDGRIVIIATQGGHAASIDLRQVMLKRATITGSTLRPQPVSFKQEIKAALPWGFDVAVSSYPGALFLSAGGYHHHLGVNVWAGPGAVPPGPDDAQLLDWEHLLPPEDLAAAARRVTAAGYAARETADGWHTAEPSGTTLRLTTTREP